MFLTHKYCQRWQNFVFWHKLCVKIAINLTIEPFRKETKLKNKNKRHSREMFVNLLLLWGNINFAQCKFSVQIQGHLEKNNYLKE